VPRDRDVRYARSGTAACREHGGLGKEDACDQPNRPADTRSRGE
jgi:hypothetical protein